MLGVLAVIDGAGHFLLFLIVHLGVDIAAAWKLPEKQWGIGILSPKPRTVGFVVFVRWGCSFALHVFNSSDFGGHLCLGRREVLLV